MPELSNIQTYVRLSGSDYIPALTSFANLLKDIGIWNEELERTFEQFEWHVETDGTVDSIIDINSYYYSKFSSKVKIQPLLVVFTPAICRDFNYSWISCDLLIEAEDLRSFTTGEYYSFVPELMRSLADAMFRAFNAPVYFTDEIQDGQDIFGIAEGDKARLWQFDYAIIPESLSDLYSNPPETHRVQLHNDYIEAWYADRWR